MERPQETAPPRMVIVWAPIRPMTFPANPAMIDAKSGARTMIRSICCEIMRRSTLHRIQRFDVDALSLAEQHHQDRKADRRLGSRHGQDEEHEHLSVRV